MPVAVVLLILAFVVGVLLTVFGLQNNVPVSLNFLGASVGPTPLSLIIFASALLGIALSGLLWLRERLVHTLDIRRRERRIRELEAEVNYLRNSSASTAAGTTPTFQDDAMTPAPLDPATESHPRPE